MDTDKLNKGPLDLKEKRDSTSRKSLREILQQGAGSSGVPEATRLQPEYLLLRFQPRAGTNQWLDTYPK
jgi:hypothetical protein